MNIGKEVGLNVEIGGGGHNVHAQADGRTFSTNCPTNRLINEGLD